ncbi:unnamed protein product [Strongylus vulgaris]|uniref:Fibronectin type-III domain-containing protein n=1 Tax=Strongylus vulgaris TaxID=40348 RepID=A0A3P7KKV4_STRVU|nr:unnamed protein product [Strongylus vulgaris]
MKALTLSGLQLYKTVLVNLSLLRTTFALVPTQSPKNVIANVLNSTAVQIRFTAPDQQRIPGVNLGYKVEFWKGVPQKGVLYRQVMVDPTSKDLVVIVDGLEKYGHYNVTVLCYTSPGDGPRSPPVFVVTDEDVPGPVSGLSIAEVKLILSSFAQVPLIF